MMDFILIPLVVGIITAGIYGLFELYARRKERLAIIEKLGDRIEGSAFEGKLKVPGYLRNFSFSALKVGCLMAGVGLGMLVALFISLALNGGDLPDRWENRELISVTYGASVLLFGGIGLLTAFVIEMKIGKKN